MQQLKTGLIYDPRMTQHKSKRKHPEKPQRVKFIMKLLQQRFYTSHPRVQYLSRINRIVTDENIRLVHPQKYIRHVNTLWPKTSHRSDITILDTYFNEKSQNCARLAVGGVLDGIDKIVSHQWSNGFACVRPPGHHSGGRHTINGFCIYNNVAIGARYLLQNQNIKRVAIVDWDVHHGDGTQHVFQKQKNVLLISIHRYDRGTFYPGTEFGDVRNQGIGEGLGSKINLPLDHVDEKFKEYDFQSPGDNQYIYLYHRIIQPVLKQYKPDFILVSSGFDAARGDPLGGFTITPNGYYYLTKKLKQFHKPVLVVLEGGYNLQSISLSAEAVMRALIGEQKYPEPIDILQNQIKYRCHLNPLVHQQIDKIIQQLSKNWPFLKQNSQLQQYTKLIKLNQKRVFGIVQKQSQSSSSEQLQDSPSLSSQTSNQSTQSAHRYNTRSKSKANEQQILRLQEIRELELQKKQWQKQNENIKKREQKFAEKQVIKQTKTKQIQTILPVKEQLKNVEQNKDKDQVQQKKLVKSKQPKKTKKKQQESQQKQLAQQNDGSVVNQFYFASGHLHKFKNFNIKSKTVHKITFLEEIEFYEKITFQKQYAPKYFGREGQDGIIIQNLLYQLEDPTIIDIKMSSQSGNPLLEPEKRQRLRKKEEKSTVSKYNFRITGFTTPEFKQGGLTELSDQQITKVLKYAVTGQNKELYCSFLKRLIDSLNKTNRKYFATSILLIKSEKRSDIRWIDFHYWLQNNQGHDTKTIEGLTNLLKFIENIS